jgi:hypothetical protein
MLVTNAIAPGRSQRPPIVESCPPRATSSSRLDRKGFDAIGPVAGPSSKTVRRRGRGQVQQTAKSRRPSPLAHASEQVLSKPFLKNREKEG